jgi:hypothetical protein
LLWNKAAPWLIQAILVEQGTVGLAAHRGNCP